MDDMDAFDGTLNALRSLRPRADKSGDRPQRKLASKLSVTLLLYFAAAWLGLLVPFTNANVSPVWPASGVAIAAVVLWGHEMLLAIFVGAFLVNYLHSIPVVASIGMGIGNSASAFLGAYIVWKSRVILTFPRLRDVFGFLTAAIFAPLPAATLGTASVFLSNIMAWSTYSTAWRVWWLGDATGILITTPLFFLCRDFAESLKIQRRLEFLFLSVATIGVSLAIFWRTGLGRRDDVLAFLVFPLIFWAAARFRAAGAATTTCLAVATAVLGAAEGTGPFVRHNPSHNVILLQAFIAVLSVTGLALGAFVAEHKRTADRLLDQTLLLDLANDAILARTIDDRIAYWNQGAERLYGWTRQEVLGKSALEVLASDYSGKLSEIKAQVLRDGTWKGEVVHSTRDGRRITVDSHWSLWRNKKGKQLGFLQINTDITEWKLTEQNLQALSGKILRVQDDERRRIARELHDSLGQYLTAVKIELDLLSRSNQPIEADSLREPLRYVDEAISETRTISHLLHPPLLDESGFASAARWYVEGFGKRSGIDTRLSIPTQLPRLPQNVEIGLFRILQESLTNVHRHSGSKSVEVLLTVEDFDLVLLVRDQGRGLPEPVLRGISQPGGDIGVGLASMRERVKELGATLDIQSCEQGTTVRVTVPIFCVPEAMHVKPFHQGDHICLLYRDLEEQIDTAGPFVLLGLLRNERCLCVLTQPQSERLLAWLEAAGLDYASEISRGALIMTRPEDAYLKGGSFRKQDMLKLLDNAMRESLAMGFSGFRGTGDLSSSAEDPACCADLVEYEQILDRHIPGVSIAGICMYNANLLHTDDLKKVMESHHFALSSSSLNQRTMRIRRGQQFGDITFESKSASQFQYVIGSEGSAEVVSGQETTLAGAMAAVEAALSGNGGDTNGTADETDSQWMASAS